MSWLPNTCEPLTILTLDELSKEIMMIGTAVLVLVLISIGSDKSDFNNRISGRLVRCNAIVDVVNTCIFTSLP